MTSLLDYLEPVGKQDLIVGVHGGEKCSPHNQKVKNEEKRLVAQFLSKARSQ